MATELAPLLVLGGIVVCSLALNVWLEHQHGKRETELLARDSELRRKLGACRTSLEASEEQRNQMRRQFNGQAVELARYRGQLPADRRLTEVFAGLPPQPPPLPPDDAA